MSVERLNLPFIERVCGRYFRKVGQRWYLRGEAVAAMAPRALFAEEVAIADELSAIAWLRQRLQARPMLIGELKPLWMRATGLLPAEVSQTLNLEDLLAENFWRDRDTNRWREPTEEERERMNDDRSLRVLHDAERFTAGRCAAQQRTANGANGSMSSLRHAKPSRRTISEQCPCCEDLTNKKAISLLAGSSEAY